MLVDITAKLVADAINAGIDAGKPITAKQAGEIVAAKAEQVRTLPGMSDLDVFDLATAVASRIGLDDTASLGLIKSALNAAIATA